MMKKNVQIIQLHMEKKVFSKTGLKKEIKGNKEKTGQVSIGEC